MKHIYKSNFIAKRKLFTVILTFAIFAYVQSSYAQLSGTKTITGDYASIAAAITDLNTVAAGSGCVTFNVTAGYTETAANLIITATFANQIIFQKSGANPVINAGVGVGSTDGIIKLSGSDYATFNGFDLM